MEFSDGEDKLELIWRRLPPEYSAESFEGSGHLPKLDQWYRIPINCGPGLSAISKQEPTGPVDCEIFERNTQISVLGRTAILGESRTVSADGESSDFTLYFQPEAGTDLFISARSIAREKFRQVLDSLHPTDVETWLAALPPRVVQPIDRPAVVDEMLEDVPIPGTVDVEELKGEASAATRYQIGVAITGAVACGWLDQWARAIEAGDDAAAEAAVEAMSTSRDWAILQEMDEQGGWSRTIWEYSEEMRRDERHALLGVAGTETLPDGRVYELSPSYATGIGCDSERRVLRDERAEVPPPSYPKPIPVDSPN
jgi:hypothetical protein